MIITDEEKLQYALRVFSNHAENPIEEVRLVGKAEITPAVIEKLQHVFEAAKSEGICLKPAFEIVTARADHEKQDPSNKRKLFIVLNPSKEAEELVAQEQPDNVATVYPIGHEEKAFPNYQVGKSIVNGMVTCFMQRADLPALPSTIKVVQTSRYPGLEQSRPNYSNE